MRLALSLLSLLFIEACKSPDYSALQSKDSKYTEDRCQEITSELNQFNQNIDRKSRKQKYDKMRASPFIFYRGTTHLYARDLLLPKSGFRQQKNIDNLLSEFESPRTTSWIQGDMHLYNMGSYHTQDTHLKNKEITYDLNDFDEAVIADFKLDVWRMATSFFLVGFKKKFNDKDIQEAIESFSQSYLKTMKKISNSNGGSNTSFTKSYISKSYSKQNSLVPFLKNIEDNSSQKNFLDEWTRLEPNKGTRLFRFRSKKDPKARIIPLDKSSRKEIIHKLQTEYTQQIPNKLKGLKVVDLGSRIEAGTGSLGKTRYYALGKTGRGKTDYIILDIKEQAKAPSLLPYLAPPHPRFFNNGAQRVLTGNKALTNRQNPYSGTINIGSKNFTIFQRSKYKSSFQIENEITSKKKLGELSLVLGEILATAHTRSDSSFPEGTLRHSLESEISKLTKDKKDSKRFIKNVQVVAKKYSQQVKMDFKIFKKSCKNGKSCSCR